MRQPLQRTLVGVTTAAALIVADATVAMAQLVQSEVEGESAPAQTTQLVTSSTEVRRAVIGLVTVAAVTALLGIWYWLKTGQLARDRHARRYGGKHGAARAHPEPVRQSPAGPPQAIAARAPQQPRPAHRPSTPPRVGADAMHTHGFQHGAQHPAPGQRR